MSEPLNILLISPSPQSDISGNAVTARRLVKGFERKGVKITLTQANSAYPLKQQPQIIHALHALKSGRRARELSLKLKCPYVVTMTGTDLNYDLMQERNDEIIDVLRNAALIITYHRAAMTRLVASMPDLTIKIAVIRPSIDTSEYLRYGDPSVPSGFNFLLPSGIRRIKDPGFSIMPLERLRDEFPQITLTIAGRIYEESEHKKVLAAADRRSWINIEQFPHEAMHEVYRKACAVLNTSASEGLSNVLLEAMFLNRPVLASDCEGNKALITHEVNGLLYRQGDQREFIGAAKRLLVEHDLVEHICASARELISNQYSLEREIEEHLCLYRRIKKC